MSSSRFVKADGPPSPLVGPFAPVLTGVSRGLQDLFPPVNLPQPARTARADDGRDAIAPVLTVLNSANQVITPGIPGKPEKFPDMTVRNEQEELAAAAKGYAQPGRSDPNAVQAARSSPLSTSRISARQVCQPSPSR